MIARERRRRRFPAAWITAVVVALAACGGDTAGPSLPSPSSVTVTSPLDSILALGGTAQLQATARDNQGNPLTGVSWTWSTSNPAAVTIGSAGLATATGVGVATVTASTQGASGSLRLRVVDADLAAVATLAGDAFANALIGALSGASSGPVQSAWSEIGAAAVGGNVQAIVDAVAALRAEAAIATDPTDQASLAVLSLYAAAVERHLGL